MAKASQLRKGLTLLVDVCFDVPVRVRIPGIIILRAADLNLLEAPLRQVDVAGAEIASQNRVFQPECRRECSNSATIPGSYIANHFDFPMVLGVSDRKIAVARDFLVTLGNRCRDFVRVQIATGLGVHQPDDVAVADEARRSFGIVLDVGSVGVEEPVVVSILVVVASDLLLARALRVCLNMGMKQTATVAHVLNGDPRAKGNLEGAILSDLGAPQVCLEERTHLRISGAGAVQNGKMGGEGEHINHEGDNDQSDDTRHDVSAEGSLENVNIRHPCHQRRV